MTNCEWCGLDSAGKTTCSARCRGGRHRWLNDVKRAGGRDPLPPPWPDSPLHGRMGERVRANAPQGTLEVESARKPGPRSGVNARSGVMIAFHKAVRAARAAVGDGEAAADAVEQALTEALAPTQRRKLEARNG